MLNHLDIKPEKIYQCLSCKSIYNFDGLGKHPITKELYCKLCQGNVAEIKGNNDE